VVYTYIYIPTNEGTVLDSRSAQSINTYKHISGISGIYNGIYRYIHIYIDEGLYVYMCVSHLRMRVQCWTVGPNGFSGHIVGLIHICV
jgi:hypothetical protein